MKPHKHAELWKEMLDLLDKHNDLIEQDYEIDIRDKLKSRIKAYEIASKFDIELPGKSVGSYVDFVRLDNCRFIGLHGEKYKRTISWPDDGKQPEDEWLYGIHFSSGAFIFHSEYPTKTFDQFFNELKSYGPKYIDTVNHYLYFDETNAKKVNDNYKNIFKKYQELAKKEVTESEIIKLQEKLEKLKLAAELK